MNEQTIWHGKPSHLLNFKYYVLGILFCWLIIPLLIMIWKIIKLKSTSYELTTERLKIRRGVFSRSMDELELYRVRDYRYEQPFILRLMGRGNITLWTTDATDKVIQISAIKKGEQLREVIRRLVENRRTGQRVSEVELINFLN